MIMAEAAKAAAAKTTPAKQRKAPVRKDLKPLDFGKMTVTVVTDPAKLREFKRTRGERDKEQVQVDNLVRQAHERWVAAGRPEDWMDCQGAALHIKVPADQYETVETRARRSGAYFDLAIRFGDRKVKDGYAEVILVAKDKPVRQEGMNDEGATTDR